MILDVRVLRNSDCLTLLLQCCCYHCWPCLFSQIRPTVSKRNFLSCLSRVYAWLKLEFSVAARTNVIVLIPHVDLHCLCDAGMCILFPETFELSWQIIITKKEKDARWRHFAQQLGEFGWFAHHPTFHSWFLSISWDSIKAASQPRSRVPSRPRFWTVEIHVLRFNRNSIWIAVTTRDILWIDLKLLIRIWHFKPEIRTFIWFHVDTRPACIYNIETVD